MANKEMLTSTLPVIDQSAVTEGSSKPKWSIALNKVWLYLKGENEEKRRGLDPAAAIILQIEDQEVARIVKYLHYRTPKSLKAMRKACEQCFVLPDDCPYYDYSIFDVKKAVRRLVVQPKHTHGQVIEELQKINNELAYHISEDLD